jgi:hypothetical protein
MGFGIDALDPSHTGQQQSGQFLLELLNGTHTMTDRGAPTMNEGDSGGPGVTNTDGTIIGVMGEGAENQTYFQRMSNVIGWVNNPVPGNDDSLFQTGGTLYFMHHKQATGGFIGSCMASSANSGTNVPVELAQCTDVRGLLNGGRAPGWAVVPVAAGGFAIINAATGGCLAPPNGAANANLRLETCSTNFSNARQRWSFLRAENPSGTFRVLRIRNESSGLCIRSEVDRTALGSLVEQTPCDAGTSAQANAGQSWIATR